MKVMARRTCFLAASSLLFFLGAIVPAVAQTTDITASPSSLSFANTYIGMASGSQVITITNQLNGQITIESMTFSCPGFGISSGIAPFTLGTVQKITHYSVFFQPTAAQTFNCNFQLNLSDGTYLDVPISGTGLTSTATASVSPSALTFSNQQVGNASAPQTVTITNTGTSTLSLSAITLTPPDFTTNNITLPYTINPGASLPVSVYYQPTQAIAETGAIDFSYSSIPDNGASLTGNGVPASKLSIASSPTMQPATQNAAYQAQFTTSGGVGPFTWSLINGSSLPSGLTLSSTGEITGTLASSVGTGNYSFTVQATDSSDGATASTTMDLTVAANLGDNCNDLSYDIPGTSNPLVAITDLGTGTFEGYEGGLYPNGSNVRPSTQDSAGVAFAQAIVPLDSNGNYSPTGKEVVLAVGESTMQNEFNRFLPIANSDPTKNPYVLLVNGAQGGATPYYFTSTTSAYWATVLNNYLPQNGVTANQVVAALIEDTDGIATGTFPSDITTLQSEYETMMQTMLTLFPNLKLVYFSSRVYAGYSNGVGKPDNPEPYAYEVGWAVKWAIQDQINGNSNLNYNSANGPVVAPWMSWGPYYWSNGMLGSEDGLVWDCADFASDGTHPSSTYGQLKTSNALLNFLKTDDTTIPWYLVPVYGLTVSGGNGQSGNPGTILANPLTVLASNLNNGPGLSGVNVSFSDGGAGGSFNPTTAVTNSSGIATTSYTLPATTKSVTITASSTNYKSATFTETAAVLALAPTAGSNQSGNVGTVLPTALTATATSNGSPAAGVSVTFSDNGAGGSFNPPTATTSSSGIATTSYTLPAAAQSITITASSSGYTSATFSETANALLISPTSGNNQSATAGTALPTPLTITATSNGNPVSGLSVTFSDNGAGGSFGTPNPTTGSTGQASSTYTLPSTAQTVTITVRGTGYTSATFTEIAVVQALNTTSGNNQAGLPGTTLPAALTVTATNNGNPVSGVSVTFSDGGAGGSFGSPTVTTGSNGQASSTYTLPSTAKTVTVTATASGYTSTTFTEISATENLSATGGNNQTGNVGTTLPTALTVTATNSGTAQSGVSVLFSDGGAGGSFNPNPATTNSSGIAATSYTLPSSAKTITISATSSGYTTATFTETSAAQVLSVSAGNNQTGNVSTTLPTALSVLATSNGNPASGVSVTFTDNGAGGTFGSPTAITGSNGLASSTYTLPSTAKSISISASSSGYSGTSFTETSEVLALSCTGGNNQIGNPGTTLPTALTITATNNGNPVSGLSVSFSDGGAGGSFGSPTVTTGSNGSASSTYTLPSTAKSITVTAAASGYTSAACGETSAVLTLSATSGNNQNGFVSTTLPTSLTVTATSNGSPVSGVTVIFTDNGAGGTFGSPTAITGSNGTASSTYTLPASAETVTISATSPSYTSTTFTETADPVVTSLALVSGGKQTGTVGATLPKPIVVKATNGSTAVRNAWISFTDGLGGTFSPNPAETGLTGQATTNYTLPTSAKTITVSASIATVNLNITEYSIAGAQSSFTIVTGNNQTANPDTKLPRNLEVKLTDVYGNPIKNVTVNFTDNGAGGTFSNSSPVTNVSGEASTSYTTGPTAGTITISASTSVLGPLNFTETVK